jgi:hypothetical protein
MRHPKLSRTLPLPARALLACALFAVLVLTLPPADVGADDTDLVRENTADPFVFFVVDTSSSMNLSIFDGGAAAMDGDDPASRIYQVKRVLYDVLKDEIDINYGLATYNQDELHVRGKHWLYESEINVGGPVSDFFNTPFYPMGTIRDRSDVDGDGDRNEILTPGDQLVFGSQFLALNADSSAVDPPVAQTAGTCTAPLPDGTSVTDADRRRINRFAKLGEPFKETPTVMWIQFSPAGPTYQLEVSLDPDTNFDGNPATAVIDLNRVGNPLLKVDLNLRELTGACSGLGGGDDEGSSLQLVATQAVVLRRVGSFLMHDQPDDGNGKTDATAGEWHWTDAFAIGVNGNVRPFSGKGIEGNYDSAFDPGEPIIVEEHDDLCVGNGSNQDCIDPPLKFETRKGASSPEDRELDHGDFLPWDWAGSNRDAFFSRLNPNHGTGRPADFGTASYFEDNSEMVTLPNGRGVRSFPLRYTEVTDGSGNVVRVPATPPPLIAFGGSPLARAINDLRCWYNGTDNDSKCAGDTERPYDKGWRFIAADKDALATCRRPFLLVISDGEDTSDSGGGTGENASADVGNLLTKSGDPGVQTWVFNLGDANNCSGGELNSIANAGKDPKSKIDNCITVSDPQNLEIRLREVLGVILEETRSFASAAVPTVQADEGDKLFLTQFRPARGKSVWRGRVLGFLKPVPLTDPPERQPKTDVVCDPDANIDSNCFLWDAGEVLLGQVNDLAPLGPNANQRRVYYARRVDALTDAPVDSGQWGVNREGFDDPLRGTDLAGTDPSNPSVSPRERDLWRGLSIPFDETDAASIFDARTTTRNVINGTYAVKTHTFGDEATPTNYILGDIFHSNPLVVGVPNNTRFFADDTDGYREFARRHQSRRSVLLMGSNDGMLHAFDAGVFVPSADPADPLGGEFSNGTGKEIFAYVPRGVMPAVKSMMLDSTSPRHWGVDGTVNAADVFIDPVFTGSPDPDDREWRTVLVGGLRRGGESYYALDITQPDKLQNLDPPGILIPDNDGTDPAIPNCQQPAAAETNTSCDGELGYPAPLWEFDDTVVLADGTRVRLDEDPVQSPPLPGAGQPDLAQTWSVPNLGRIRVRQDLGTGEAEVTKHVAIFGGGIDPSDQLGRGNYLYMVDIETGKAIYKARLEGGAPAEPAAIDSDQDGEIDRIYIGTLAGFLYRVDLVGPNGELPLIDSVPVPGVPNQQRIVLNAGDPWVPRKIFDTMETVTFQDANGNNVSIQISRPIYFRPSVIFVAELGEFALAFGTGNRENLWGGSDTTDGRFYVFVDETEGNIPPDPPITQDDLFHIVADDPSPDPSDPNDPIQNNPEALNPLIAPGADGIRGWFFELQPKERVVTNAFALSGITVFSTFIPRVDPAIAPDGGPACALRGISRAFAVFTTNGVGTLFDATTGVRTRNTEVSSLATEAYIERGQTKNPASQGDTSDALDSNLQRVMDELKSLFPENCKFANYRLDIKTISANTGVVHIAPVPVCIIEKNWREF